MNKLQKRINELQKKRLEAIESMTVIVDSDTDDVLLEEEALKFTELEKSIKEFDAGIERAEKMLDLQAKAAIEIDESPIETIIETNIDKSAAIIVDIEKDIHPADKMVRLVKSLANAQNNYAVAAQLAEKHYGDTPGIHKMLRAQSQGMPTNLQHVQHKAVVPPADTIDPAWAGALVYADTLASEFIDWLRPETIVGKLTGMRNIPFNVQIPRQIAAMTAANWVGQSQQKPVGKAEYDNILFPWAKMALITAFSDELLRFSNPQIDILLREEIVKALVQFTDEHFISDVAATPGVSPGGIRSGATSYPSTGQTVASVTDDFNTILTHYATNNLGIDGVICIMSPRTENYLMSQRTAQEIFSWKSEMMGGTIMGIPYISSNYVPTNLGAGLNESFILFVKQSEVFVAQEGFTVDTSKEASIQMVDTVGGEFSAADPLVQSPSSVSLWQNNLTALRCERYMYWEPRRDPSEVVALISAVLY